MRQNKFIYSVFIFFISVSRINAEYPVITDLNSSSYLFRQLSDDITKSYVLLSNNEKPLPINIYSYNLHGDETLFQVASRVNLPYESISTLNRISSISDFKNLKKILIPNQPVLFIPDKPETDIEYLLNARDYIRKDSIRLKINNSEHLLHYKIDSRFNNTERAFFLNTFFRFPLQGGRISSHYGTRKNPISGKIMFHNGIDISAPAGSPVFASGSGSVSETGWDNILGNYIIIQHPGSYQTVYGHLKKSFVLLEQNVKSGTVIGEVGSTGYSTGPHLHFEVRIDNTSKDPVFFLNRNQ